MIHELSRENSVLNHFVSEIRDAAIQKDAMRFRKNMERISEIMAYEVSKTLQYRSVTVITPLGKKETSVISEKLVVASVLRAGLTMHQGVLNYFDYAENAFISAYREEGSKADIKVHVEYLASPDLNGKTLLLVDPMLATGNSILLTLKAMKKNGSPEHIHIICAIASKEGIDKLKENVPPNTTIWVADIDDKLNDQAYIVPGLGDAGDLAFGTKL